MERKFRKVSNAKNYSKENIKVILTMVDLIFSNKFYNPNCL